MTTPRLIVELEPDAVPRGRVIDAEGQRFPFAGWVGLAAALERARTHATEPSSDPLPDTGNAASECPEPPG
jgi:hypothetical protein